LKDLNILDERVYAQMMLEKGFIKGQVFRELIILAKYLKSIGKSEYQIDIELNKFCMKWLKDYNFVKTMTLLNRVVSIAKKRELKEAEPIVFSKQELDVIRELKDIRKERVLFMLCFFAKLNKTDCCFVKDSTLFSSARVGAKANERTQMLRDLYLMGFIRPLLRGGNRVIFLSPLLERQGEVSVGDEASETVEFKVPPLSNIEGEGIVIDRFENPIAYYVKYIGGLVKWCSGCGVPFEATGNRAKWCKDCGHIERLRIWKERKMEERKRDE